MKSSAALIIVSGIIRSSLDKRATSRRVYSARSHCCIDTKTANFNARLADERKMKQGETSPPVSASDAPQNFKRARARTRIDLKQQL